MDVRKPRSPSYPSLDLEAAIGRAENIQSAYSTSSVDRTAIVTAMGYSGLNGSALQALASLTAYGLLERRGKGEAGITDLAMKVLFSESSRERAEGAREAALSPPAFAMIASKFGEQQTTRADGIVAYLCRNGFNAKAASIASRSYIESMRFLASIDGDKSGSPQASLEESGIAPTEAVAAEQAYREAPFDGFRDLVRGETSDGVVFRLLVDSDIGPVQWGEVMKVLAVHAEIGGHKREVPNADRPPFTPEAGGYVPCDE